MTEAEKREFADLKARVSVLEKNLAALTRVASPRTQPLKAPIRRA